MKRSLLFIFATYIVLLHGLLVFMLVKTDFLRRLAVKLGWACSPTSQQQYYEASLTFQSRSDLNAPSGLVIFLGDSHIQGLCVSAIGPNCIDYGIGGDDADGVRRRIGQYTSIPKAKAVVLEVGINNLLRGKGSLSLLAEYEKLLNRLPATVPVFACGVLPIDSVAAKSGLSNSTVAEFNLGLRGLCDTRKNCHYVAPPADLVDQTGALRENLHIGDGLHLNQQGNQRWIDQIRASLKQTAIME